ncbi:MAG: hypothetical protein ACK56I_37235 [bacterium]
MRWGYGSSQYLLCHNLAHRVFHFRHQFGMGVSNNPRLSGRATGWGEW